MAEYKWLESEEPKRRKSIKEVRRVRSVKVTSRRSLAQEEFSNWPLNLPVPEVKLNVSAPPSLQDPRSQPMVRAGMLAPAMPPTSWPNASSRSLLGGPYDALPEDFGTLTRPKGVDLMDNVRAAEAWKSIGMDNPDILATGLKYWTFRNHVRDGGPWDYKRRDKKFENFGNYNYGLTGAAAGISSEVLLRMAGRAQKQNAVTAMYGSPASFWDAINGRGGRGAFGDDRKDQYWIKKGFEDYARLKAGKSLSQYP